MKIGSKEFDIENKTHIMAILNVTPDSFSDGGSYQTIDAIRRRAQSMISEGAEIIDIGGESTRPGYTPISDAEEIRRIVPAIECIRKDCDVPISVDTYKPVVARAAIEAGADMINDIWGLKYDNRMAEIIAKEGVSCVLMHNQKDKTYRDFLPECRQGLAESLKIAQDAGIAQDKIVLDPGVGFAKNYEQNLSVIKHLDYFGELGMPMLLGTSRKSVIGLALDLPVTERVEGTLVTSVYAVLAHYAFVRVHDVAANLRAIRMAEAIRDAR